MNGKGNNKDVKAISDSLLPAGGECAWFFVKAGEKPDLDELSKAEIEALDAAIDKYKDMDTKTLSELSHDSAWHEAWDKNHNAVMTSLNIAKAGDASNEFLEYLQEQEFIDSILEAQAIKMKGKINKNDLVEIKKAICSYENVSMKLLKRFGLI